ncbi:tetratricopeptide repeat protein [Plasticicumulans acidivorans]|uniref:Tfp pilus assembly protein PilF n=1 Tax=Plasticicumulans acidivorans TaxID=886464 RepID=A0A317MWD5_9GAMM|nr:tetratricopeptide repeat protein [Plasticicumulans acidivorans]PWV63169.1 Tfp pilus assembly protein PilF [Plasticicumulans acidivorans]
MNEPTELRFYNPGWLSDEALIASFTARQALFEFLRDELRRAPRQGTVQHYLLVGVRGAGKTTLLQRLAVAIRQDTDLADHLLGLSFPEELYAIKGLADFWWAACEALVDALERRGRRAEADALDAQIEGRRAQQRTAGLHDDSGLRLLKQVCDTLQLRPVLLLDNLDQLLERLAKSGRKKDLLTPAYWALREALSSADAPLLIGASVRLSEPFTDYDKAFYDFFVPQRLDRLSLDEVQAVFDRLAEGHGGAALRERIRARPGRVRALYELTGGNPRALGLLFELLRQGTHARAVDDFERLMDQTTPYYKARFEELPEQAQLVMHALATARRDRSALDFGHTAAALAEHCGLDTRTVSAQLDVLINAGLVEKDSPASGRMRYRIAEQLFRLWLQMRGSRRIRQQVITLTEFIEALYDSEEREALLRSTYDRLTASHDSRAKLQWALGELQPSVADRRCLQSYATDTLLASAEHRTRFDAILAPGDLPVELEWLAQARQQLLAALPRLQSLSFSEQHLEALLGALTLDEDSKRTHVARLLDPATAAEELTRLKLQLGDESQLLRDFGLSDSDICFLHHERSCGRLLLESLSPDDRELRDDAQRRELAWTLLGAGGIPIATAAQAEAWLAWSKEQFADASSEEWAAFADRLRKAGQTAAAQAAVDTALVRGESAEAWFQQAALLHDADPAAAEVAFRKAINLDPQDAWPWHNLGFLLAARLQRYDEAEAAYRKAIDLDPRSAWPWVSLGILLADHLQRYDEAEAAYRKAIDLNPRSAWPWKDLGLLLSDHLQRYDEAEAAYRKAIDLDPQDAWPWNNLGNLLAARLQRYDEAETAFRKAAELSPESRNVRAALLCLQARNALSAGDECAARQHLGALLADVPDVEAYLASPLFVEILTGHALHSGRGPQLLALLRELGFERYAAPLLLALAAAVTDNAAGLEKVEPELRSAAQTLFERLQAVRPADQPEGGA